MVSIVVPVLDTSYLDAAVESVLAQSYRDWELILVDDGTPDERPARWATRFPERIRCLEHPGRSNRGIASSRNLGIQHARGELLAFLDADDIWLPDKLAEQVALLEEHPDVDMVRGHSLYFREGSADFRPPLGLALGPHSAPALLWRCFPLGRGEPPCPSEILIRREAAHRIGLFQAGYSNAYEDQAFYAKVYLRCRVYVSDRAWIRYRLHANSCTSRHAQERNRLRRAYLSWLGGYLAAQRVAHPRVWAAYAVAWLGNRLRLLIAPRS